MEQNVKLTWRHVEQFIKTLNERQKDLPFAYCIPDKKDGVVEEMEVLGENFYLLDEFIVGQSEFKPEEIKDLGKPFYVKGQPCIIITD